MKLRLVPLLLCFLSFGHFCANAQTTVTGSIYSSTTWTMAGSPYTIANDIVLFGGATLAIEPGVVIQFADNVTFEVRGALVAVGSVANRITFTSANSNPVKGIYKGIVVKTATGSLKMAYCNASYAYNFLNLGSAMGLYTIHNCYFSNNINVVGDLPYGLGFLKMDSCKFEANDYGVGSYYSCCHGTLTNCLFVNNKVGANVDSAINCVFTGSTNFGVFAYTFLQNCEAYGNNTGVEWDGHASTTMVNNYIHGNVVGVQLDRFWDQPGIKFTGNTICSNTSWNVFYKWINNISLESNCWCSTDSAYIRSKIMDGYTNTAYGLVSYDLTSTCIAGVTAVPSVGTVQSNIKIYPNPFSSSTTIEFPWSSNHTFKIEINDQLGRTVRSVNNIKNSSVLINRGDMAPGLYFYKLTTEEEMLSAGKLLVE